MLSFTVDDGEFVVLDGPSGSGKSTTMHLVAALDRPTSGRIVVHGRDIARHRHRLDRYRREEVGVIFQLHNLLPHLDAQQNVEIVMLGTQAAPPRSARARAGAARGGRSRARRPRRTRRSSRAANASASRSHARSRTIRRSYSPTSRPAASTTTRRRWSSGSCATAATAAGRCSR